VHAHRSELDFWHFLPVKPEVETSFKRWSLIVIALLALLVAGVFVAGLGSLTLHSPVAASAPPRAIHHLAHHG